MYTLRKMTRNIQVLVSFAFLCLCDSSCINLRPSTSIVLERLNSHTVPNAIHDPSGSHLIPPCIRRPIMDKLTEWINHPDDSSLILWLYGPIGVGKSAVGRSLLTELDKVGTIVASYFFSRSSPDRSRKRSLIPTLVYQLVQSIPSLAGYVLDAILNDPSIFKRLISKQIDILLVQPLRKAFMIDSNLERSRILILVDGLDECGGEGAQATIIKDLVRSLSGVKLGLRVIVSSRPELEIRDVFGLQSTNPFLTKLFLGAPDDSSDIETYFQSRFTDVLSTHPLRTYIPPEWPSLQLLAALVENASCSFAYAASIMDFISCPRHRPQDRLGAILSLDFSHADSPFTSLDGFYRQTLANVRPDVLDMTLDILSYIILQPTAYPPHFPHTSTTCARIETLFGYREGDVQLALCDLHSLVNVSEQSPGTNICAYHTSFGHWLFTPKRAGNYHVDRARAHASIAKRLIHHLPSNSGA